VKSKRGRCAAPDSGMATDPWCWCGRSEWPNVTITVACQQPSQRARSGAEVLTPAFLQVPVWSQLVRTQLQDPSEAMPGRSLWKRPQRIRGKAGAAPGGGGDRCPCRPPTAATRQRALRSGGPRGCLCGPGRCRRRSEALHSNVPLENVCLVAISPRSWAWSYSSARRRLAAAMISNASAWARCAAAISVS
jgi:hypothetical protein